MKMMDGKQVPSTAVALQVENDEYEMRTRTIFIQFRTLEVETKTQKQS